MEATEYPTTTEIIYSVLPIAYEVDDYYLQRGKAVHFAIELLLKNNLDESTLDETIKPYIASFKEFLKILYIEPLVLEKRYYNDRLKYSGKPDIIAIINGENYVIDIKTSSREIPQWRLQTAAYAELAGVRKRAVIYYCNEKWRFSEHKDKTDIYTFYSCLSVYNFMIKNNMKRGDNKDVVDNK